MPQMKRPEGRGTPRQPKRKTPLPGVKPVQVYTRPSRGARPAVKKATQKINRAAGGKLVGRTSNPQKADVKVRAKTKAIPYRERYGTGPSLAAGTASGRVRRSRKSQPAHVRIATRPMSSLYDPKTAETPKKVWKRSDRRGVVQTTVHELGHTLGSRGDVPTSRSNASLMRYGGSRITRQNIRRWVSTARGGTPRRKYGGRA